MNGPQERTRESDSLVNDRRLNLIIRVGRDDNNLILDRPPQFRDKHFKGSPYERFGLSCRLEGVEENIPSRLK